MRKVDEVQLPDADVEEVGAEGAGYGHVAQSLPGHDDASDQIGHACSSCNQREAHDLKEREDFGQKVD